MAIDIAAIKRKLEQLEKGESAGSNSVQWRPKPGEYDVRVVPWPNMPEGEVYKERQFYYDLERFPILALRQFNEPDPVRELQSKLYEGGTDGDKALAKKLYPRPRMFAAIVVRGEESRGVRLWSLGKDASKDLLELFVDESVGDYTDPDEGYDLRVKISAKADTQFYITKVSVPRNRNPSKLSNDPKQAKEWLRSTPDLDSVYEKKSYDELSSILNKFVNNFLLKKDEEADAQKPEDKPADAADESPKGRKAVSEDAGEEEKPAKKPRRVVDDDDEEEKPVKKAKKSLDDIVEELNEDD